MAVLTTAEPQAIASKTTLGIGLNVDVLRTSFVKQAMGELSLTG